MNKLLVIGNGFDLSCNAKTRYEDFFNSGDYEIIKALVDIWVDYFDDEGNGALNINKKSLNFSCWDLLFYLETKKDNQKDCSEIKWCDIEKVIHNSLTDTSSDHISWNTVFHVLNNEFYNTDSYYSLQSEGTRATKIMCHYMIKKGWKEDCKAKNTFYKRLLAELKNFERKFGGYIYCETNQEDYRNKANALVRKLAEDADVVKIDSFNYSDFWNSKIRHINGDTDNPIFGIDLTESEEKEWPEARCFTKTSRRVYQDSHNQNNETEWDATVIEGAVIYGHSLNQMDYDYFNYLFTLLKINTFDVEKMGKIEFVYKIHKEELRDEIRNRTADSIYALLNYYEKYVSKSNQHILINLLRFSGKLIIREID